MKGWRRGMLGWRYERFEKWYERFRVFISKCEKSLGDDDDDGDGDNLEHLPQAAKSRCITMSDT